MERGVRYALAIGKKVEERGYDAVTLLDVDGMKKLLGFPPAMVFMLLNRIYGVQVIPENDILGSATQLMMHFATEETVPYLEYYEFFKDYLLAGVPDFIPESAVDGPVSMLPAAFGLLNSSLLNVSEVKTGLCYCSRLLYRKGRYAMHFYTGNAKSPVRGKNAAGMLRRLSCRAWRYIRIPVPLRNLHRRWADSIRLSAMETIHDMIRTMCRLADIDIL